MEDKEWKEELINLGHKSKINGMISIHDAYDLIQKERASMKQKAIKSVPKRMPTGYHGYRKFNACREQTLQALNEI